MDDPNETLLSPEERAAWDPQSPSPGFSERVLEQVMREKRAASDATLPSRGGRRTRYVAGAAIVAATAAAAMVFLAPRASHGEAIAKDRTQVAVGSRAAAVLEPGAHVTWQGDDVIQDTGDVFYRVEPGANFRVHTPAGDVTVHGTCFRVKVRNQVEKDEMNKRDVKAGVTGAALSALAFVAVYEGKVAVSHARESVQLTAGEAAEADSKGVRHAGDIHSAERGFDAKTAKEDEALSLANRNLVDSVSEYKTRLEAIEVQKAGLEKDLATAKEKLAAAENDGSAPAAKHAFDLSTEDWAALAQQGTVKFRLPCERAAGWTPPQETLDKLGLAPQDGKMLKDSYARSNQRVWAQIKPLCAQAIGSAEAAEKIGVSTCKHLILDMASAADREAANEAMRQVGEIRAGQRPMPGANEAMSPVLKMFLSVTGESKLFESDLAQSLGPEEAHRVTFSDNMCMSTHSFGGPGPRQKP